MESRFAVERRNRTIHSRMRRYLYELKHRKGLETAIIPIGTELPSAPNIRREWNEKDRITDTGRKPGRAENSRCLRADAVYIGGEAFGLRAKAHNFSNEEMKQELPLPMRAGSKST